VGPLNLRQILTTNKDTTMFSLPRFAVACASVLLFAPHAVAAQYGFVNIADTRGPFEGFGFTSQAVSDTGTVAFIGNQGGVNRTYVGSGGAVQPVVPNLDEPPPAGFSFLDDWALNASGVAARMAQRCCGPWESIIQLYEASGTSTIAYGTGGSPTVDVFFSRPAISNGGAVVFGAITRDRTIPPTISQANITRWFNGTSTTLLDTSEGFEGVGLSSVRLNEHGDVAFRGFNDGEGSSYYRTDGTTLTYIAGPFQASVDGTAINDSGAVAFYTRLDAGGEGIFVGDGGPLTTVAIADPTTPFYEFEDEIDINNQGTVAFTARLWNGSFGIYAGEDPVNEKVVEIGDFLFGQRVSGLGRPHLNNRGDISFWFSVLDPREPFGEWSGIALAVKESPLPGDFDLDSDVDGIDFLKWQRGESPVPLSASDLADWQANYGASGSSASAAAVPETGTLVLCAMSVLALVGMRHGRHHSITRNSQSTTNYGPLTADNRQFTKDGR
jgi:hypothetical protein